MEEYTTEQEAELRDLAGYVLEADTWDKLSRDDKKAGKTPIKPTKDNLEAEYNHLVKLAEYLRNDGIGDLEKYSTKSMVRLVGLEYSATLNIYNLEPEDRSQKAKIHLEGKVIELEYTIDEVSKMTCVQLDILYKVDGTPYGL